MSSTGHACNITGGFSRFDTLESSVDVSDW